MNERAAFKERWGQQSTCPHGKPYYFAVFNFLKGWHRSSISLTIDVSGWLVVGLQKVCISSQIMFDL